MEKEENWLSEMAKKGWFFQKLSFPGIYTFINGPCEDVIYKIDFNENIKDNEEYYDLFRQSGWKFIHKILNFKYFRYAGDVSAYSKEAAIYNEPAELLTWLRKRLIFFLLAYGVELVALYTSIFLEGNVGSIFTKAVMGIVAVFSFILIRFINSYILLKRKSAENKYKDYYKRDYFKRAYSAVSLLIFPVLICTILAVGLTFMTTVGSSEKSVKATVLKNDRYSMFPMEKVDYVASQDFDNLKVFLYGNNEKIGVMVMNKLFLNRYKVVQNFHGDVPPNQLLITEGWMMDNIDYSAVYGRDEKNQISKFNLIYSDGSVDEITSDSFIKQDNNFLVFKMIDKDIKEVKAFDKNNNEIMSEMTNRTKH